MIDLVLADDHTVIRKALSELLQNNENLNVVGEAENGIELLELLKSVTPDIIILDVNMPKLDGFEALKSLKSDNKTPAVLVLSADDKASSVRAALEAGAKGYLPKNVKFTELLFAIESLAQGRTYLSPSVTEKLMHPDDADTHAKHKIDKLSDREKEILVHIANGTSHKEIGVKLHISSRTVDTHRSNILKKLEVKSNAELVKVALANDLISLDN